MSLYRLAGVLRACRRIPADATNMQFSFQLRVYESLIIFYLPQQERRRRFERPVFEKNSQHYCIERERTSSASPSAKAARTTATLTFLDDLSHSITSSSASVWRTCAVQIRSRWQVLGRLLSALHILCGLASRILQARAP